MRARFALFLTSVVFSFPLLAATDLNTATQAELEAIKGIGPSKAKAIIEYREKNGGFKAVEELEKIKGIGKKSMKSMASQLKVGETEAAATDKK